MPANANAEIFNWVEQVVEGGTIGNGYSHGQYPSEGAQTHPGIDIGGGCGLPVNAAADGKVIRLVTEADRKDFASLGNAVVIQHKDEPDGRPTFTLYLHMMNAPDVEPGSIFKGDLLGYTGNTGAAKGCHLHFEVRHFLGTRSVYHPTIGRIYVPGDRSEIGDLEPDWSDPEEWIEKQGSSWLFPSDEDHVLKGGILRRGISGRVDTVDPHRSSTPWENIVIGDMFVGLVDVTPDGKVIPGVAKVWTHDKTGLVWTFNLRNDVTWSDGVPLTAHDFVYAFRRLQNPATASMFSSLLYVIKNAQQVNNGEAAPEKLGVRAVDDHTLEISLTERVPYLPELLSHPYAYPVPQRIVEKYGDNEWGAPKNIVVNGPYKLVYWRSGDQLVTEKNPNFWASESLCYDRVAYFEIEDNKLVEERIDSGELDINNSFDGVRTAELRQRYPGWVRTSPSLFTTYWSFNQTKPPFDDVRVRHALTMALDRDFIVENILSPGYSPAYSFVPPTISNYETDRPRFRWTSLSRKERLKKAKDLLLEAGYGPDNPLTFEYIFRSTGESPKVASVAQSNWNEIAPWVDAQISSAKPIVLYGRLRQNDFEIADGAWKADINDPISFLHLLNSRIGSQNYGNYNNPEYDNLLKSAALKTDLKHRAELFARAEQLMLDDAGVSPMWFGFTENLASPQITGWSEHPMDIHRSRWMCRVNPHEN